MMSSVILQRLTTVRDLLDATDAPICTAHIQMVIGKLDVRETQALNSRRGTDDYLYAPRVTNGLTELRQL